MTRASVSPETEWLIRQVQRLTVRLSADEIDQQARCDRAINGEVQVTHRPAVLVSDADLNDPIMRPAKEAIYGRDVIAREMALRHQTRTVDLRGDDEPEPDREARRWHEDPLAAAEVRATETMLGGDYERETQFRQRAAAREKQRVEHEVVPGWSVTCGATGLLRTARRLVGGDEVRLDDLGKRPELVLNRLRQMGAVTSLPPDVAFLRSRPSDVGPWVVMAETLRVGAKTLKRGASVSPDDFPPLEMPRRLADGDRISDMTAGELRAIITAELERRLPGPSVPRPMCDFDRAVHSGAIAVAPNYVAPKKGKSS